MGCFAGCQSRAGFDAGHRVREPHEPRVRDASFSGDEHLFVVTCRGQVAARRLRHGEKHAIVLLHVAIADAARPAPFDAPQLHPHEIVGVVDNAHLICFGKAHTQSRLSGHLSNYVLRFFRCQRGRLRVRHIQLAAGGAGRRIGSMRILLALALTGAAMRAQNLPEFEKRVTEFTLPNGLHFIILERHEAPVVSFHTYVDAGSVDDSSGRTGIAHMFEHMAFKGTEAIGSKNLTLEKKAMAAIETAYDALDQEKRKGAKASAEKMKELQAKLKDAISSADSYVDSELYTRLMEDNGAVGLNASTGVDQTQYFLSYPSNRLELWFLMEADRFRNPVFREFYKERDVVREEKRMRSESDPQGELMDALLGAAFQGHPYKVSPAGLASDIENYRVSDAASFRKTYYVPGNMTIAIAGDVDPKEARRLAEKYFGPMPAGPLPPKVVSVEPAQNGERRVKVESAAQPMLFVGYKRPEQTHPDDVVFDVINGIISGGRTGRIYKELVEKKIALGAATATSFPGGKYPNLYILFALPNSGKTIEDLEKAIYEIIEKLKSEPVDEVTLRRVKTRVRAGLIRQLGSNSGLAAQLASYHASYGDWRMMFKGVEEIDRVTAADVQRVAKTYFVEKGRTVAHHVKPAKENAQ